MKKAFTFVALVAALNLSCASRAPTARAGEREAELRIDALTLVKLRAALEILEVREEEPFTEFVQRTRAALIADDEPALRTLAIRLPDDPSVIGELGVEDPGLKDAFPLVFARWARGFLRSRRIQALSRVIKHKTINPVDTDTPGRSPAFDGLEKDLADMSKVLGLSFDHVDHIAYEMAPSYAQLDSKKARRDSVGVLVHADVVPADEPGWTVPPFAGEITEDRILGRGAIDDKGPMIAVMWVLAAMQASDVRFTHPSVLMVGTSEETHWDGIERYKEAKVLPERVVVADGGFPVGVGEKGIATVRVSSQPFDPSLAANIRGVNGASPRFQLLSITGGQVANQVPAEAEATLAVVPGVDAKVAVKSLKDRAFSAKGSITAEAVSEAEVRIRAAGMAAHSASPADGENAIAALVRFLVNDADLMWTPCAGMLQVMDNRIGMGFDPSGIGVSDRREGFTEPTVNLGVLKSDDTRACEAVLNLRWPPPRTSAQIVDQVKSSLVAEGARLSPPVTLTVKGGGLDPIETDPQSPLVKALQDAYFTVKGERGELLRISGTTYAKAVPGAVTFGPNPPDAHRGRYHGPNEFIGIDEFDALVEMYAFALARLGL